MKRKLLLLLALMAIGLSGAWAYDFSAFAPSGQMLSYNIVGGNAQVTCQNSSYPYYSTYPTGALVIPSTVTYNGTTYSVTSIGGNAFENCRGLTSVTIPNSVTSIGDFAFYDCSGLTSVTIGNSVTSIGNYAFYGCSNVDTLYYNSRNLTTTSEWYNNSSHGFRSMGLNHLVIGDSVQTLPSYVFYGQDGLTSVTIPNSVTSIGERTFYYCSGLTSVTIGNSVTTIGYSAFGGCSGLTSVTIPNSVTSIGGCAFDGCSGLTSVTIPNSVTSIGSNAFSYCSGLTSVTIPNSVTSIGDVAFDGCSGLTSVTIPNSVTSIGELAFGGCSGLTSVTIPNSVTSIGYGAFYNCSGLASIIVESGNTYYDSRNNCNAIIETNTNKLIAGCKNTIIPNSVTSIGDFAFYDCSGLTSVTIPNSVTSIGELAFYGCSGLTSVTIPNSVTSIGYWAFAYCSGLTSVTIGNSVTSIEEYAFYGCSGLTSVTIGNSVTSIEEYAFYGCSNVDTLYYNARNLTTTSEWYNNSSHGFRSMGLNHLVIGDSVQTLPSYVFYGQDGLTSVTIPNSVTSIGDYAFRGCSGLTSVTIPNSVTSIGDYAFRGCSGLTSVTIPNSVTSIGGCAFYGCSSLTSVTIPNSVTSIGERAFYNCSGLTSVTIPNSVTSIGYGAFEGCSGLTSVTIPNSVTTIGDGAFAGCSGFTSVTIPNSVTSIGDYAFYNCSGLTSVTMRGTVPPTLGGSVFYGNAYNRKIYVPCGAYDNYYNANNGWSDYRNYLIDPIVDIDVTVNTDTERGSASVIPLRGQNTRCDSTVVVSATPNYGYHFDYWSTGSTLAQDTIAIEGDTVITAYFAKNQYAVNVVPNYPARGNVYGSDTIDYLDSVTISAVANYGYRFSRWNDGSTDNPYTIQVVGDDTYTAIFVLDTFSLSVSSIDTIMGSATYSVRGTDDVIVGTGTSGNYNAPFNNYYKNSMNESLYLASEIGASGMIDTLWYYCTSANTHNYTTLNIYMGTTSATSLSSGWVGLNDLQLVYSATNGSIATRSGWEPYKLDTPFDYNGTDNLIIVVCRQAPNYNQAKYQYTSTNNMCRYRQSDDNSNYGLISNTTAGNTSSERANIKLSIGASASGLAYTAPVTLVATANYGYHFDHWNDGDTTNPRVIVMDSNKTFVAHFDYNQYTVTGTSANAVMGSVEGTATQNYLTNITLSATPNYGYHFTQWNDGSTVNPRVVQVDDNATYTAYFDYNQYQLTVTSANTVQGSCSGSGAYNYLSNRNISATANYGYHFTQWSDGNTNNPRTIQLTQDTVFTAEFAINQYEITLVSGNTELGQVNGGGTFDYLDTITLTAAPIDHHHLVRWSDGNRENPRQWVVTEDATLTAYFAIDTHSVTVVSNDPTRGMVTSSGSEFEYLSPCTVTATAYTGFVFTGWSNGVTANPYTFAVQSDVELTAIFVSEDELMFTITVETDDPTMGRVSGGGMAMSGGEVTIHAVANEGYHFVRWNDNNTNADRTVIVTEDATYTAYFAADQYQLTAASADTVQGTCSGSGAYSYLANRTIQATANYGYHFTQWSDGNTDNPRIIQLTQDTLFTAEFAKNQYAVNVVSGNPDMGNVYGADTIDYLDSITISAVANYGYHFTRWNDNDTHQVRTVQVTQNKTYTANFDYNQYQLTAASADTVQGTCSGSGAYSYLANRTIQATANYGYHFTQWSDGNTENPRTIQLTQDTVFSAEFAINQYEITLVSGNTDLGQVNGGGTFDYLDTITLTATTIAEHHHFVRWSDGNRENPRQWVVSEDMILTAYFAIDTHSVTVVSNDPTRGMVTSSGSEFEYLSPCTVTATAYTGFVFTGWSNGVTATPYTFAVQSDVELTAIFVSEDELMFTITVETDDPTMGSVSGGGMAMSGGEVTIHAVANEGYHFVRWNDNDTNADRTVIVTEDATYTAYFAADQTQGIDEVEQMPTIVVRGNSITVANAQNQMLSIYDVTGRMIVREKAVDGKAYTMPNTGVYMVQVGNHPAEKVVVIK